jgi:hypothetical protein
LKEETVGIFGLKTNHLATPVQSLRQIPGYGLLKQLLPM